MKIMRNGKRLLATLLAAVMMVTSSGFTALAEGITYHSSGTSIANDDNNIPNGPIDSYDNDADGDGDIGIYNDDHIATIPDGSESEKDGYGDSAPSLPILWLADKNSIQLEASLKNPGEDTAAEITIHLDEEESAALQQPLPKGIDLHQLDEGGAELCVSLSAASPEFSDVIRFVPLVPELTVEVTDADVSVTFSGAHSETAGYSFTGEPLSLVLEGSCHWTLEAASEEEEVLWTQEDPQDMHFTVCLNPAEDGGSLPAQSQVMDVTLTLPQPFVFVQGDPVWDETIQQITLNGIPAASLSGFDEKENVTVTELSLSGEILSFAIERIALEGESLSPLTLSLTVYGGAVTVKRPEPAIMTFSLTESAQAGPLREAVQMRLDARLTSIPFAGEAYAGEAAGTASLSLRAAGDIEAEAWESVLSGKFFWCDGYEREFRPSEYPTPTLQFRETDAYGNPLPGQEWAEPTKAQLAAMDMEQLPDVTVLNNANQSSGTWSVPANTLPTQVTTTDIFGDKTTRYYEWQVVASADIPNYMLLEVTEENQEQYPTVSETGWYYMLLDTYSFDITIRWGTRGEEGGQPGISNAILQCLDLEVMAGAGQTKIRLDALSEEDQVVITPDSGEHPNHAVFSIVDIPKYNIDNTLISYTVGPYENHDGKLDHTELLSLNPDEWYTVTYDNTGTSHGNVTDKVHDGGHIYFTLSGTTEFSAQKVWLDGGDQENRPAESLVQLWRYREGQPYTNAAPVRDKNGKILEMTVPTNTDQLTIDFPQVDLDGDGQEDPLPQYDPEGYRYIYVMREYLEGANAENYEQVFGSVEREGTTGDVTYTDQVPPTETALPEETVRPTASRGNDNTYVYDGGTLSNRRKGTTYATAIKSWEAAAFQAQLDGVKVEFTLQSRPKGESTGSEDGWETVLGSDGNPVQIVMENFTAEDLVERSETRSASKYGPFGREMEYRWVESGVYQKGADGTYGENLLEDGVFTLQQDGREILYRSESTVCQEEDGSWATRLENSIANTITYHVEKRWHQSLNPKPITLQLYVMGADGTVGTPLCEFTLDGTADGTPTTVAIDGFGSFTVQEGENGTPGEGSEIGHIWTADFSDLPQYDSGGRLYEYVLLEKVDDESGRIPQSETTKDKDGNYTTILTNGPGDGNQILVRKSWIDDGDSLHREAVTIGVYHKSETDPATGAPLRITGVTLENGIWLKEVGIGSYTSDDVFLVEEKMGQAVLDCADRLQDKAASHYVEGTHHIYEVTYSEKEELAGAFCYTVTNRRLGTINITATKHWNDGGNNGQRIEEALKDIPEDERPRLVLRLQFANELAQYDIRRADAGYDEISLGGAYVPVRDNGGNPDAENGGETFTILRDLEYGANDTEYYFSALPKYDTEGRVAHYTIEEIWVNSNGQEVTLAELAEKSTHKQAWQTLLDVWGEYSTTIKQTGYSVEEHRDRDAQAMSVTNSRVGYKEIRWHKQWQDAYAYQQGVRPDLYLDLYRYTSNPDTAQKLTLYRSNYRWWPVASEEEDPDGLYDEKWHWHAVFSGLDKYDADGYEYTYYAIEHTSVNASDFDYLPAQYKKPADEGTGTVSLGTVDEPLDNSAVESGWMIQLAAECACNQQDVGKYLLREEGTFLNALSGEAIIQGNKIWTGLPAGYDRENDLPGVIFTVQQKLDGTVVDEDIATLTITPENWKKLQASGRYKFTIQYQGSNVVHITGEGDQQKIAFHPEGDSQSWKPLPKYDETNGKLYEYTLSESVQFIGNGAPPDDVVFVKGESGFSFNNQYISRKNLTPFTAQKHLYLPKDENNEYVFPGVTFQLSRTYLKNDGSTSSSEILGTASWKSEEIKAAWDSMTDEDEQKQNGYVTGTISFGDQEIYAPNGSLYTYTVTEIKENLAGFDTWAAKGDLAADAVMADANKHDPAAEGAPAEPQVTDITLQSAPGESQDAPIYATFANKRMDTQQILTAIQGTKLWKDFGNHFKLRAQDFTAQAGDKGGDSSITLTLSRYAKTQPGQNNAIDLEPVTATFTGDWFDGVEKDPITDEKNLYSTWYYTFVAKEGGQVLEKYAPNGMPWIYVVEETLTDALSYYDVEEGRVELPAEKADPTNNTLTLPELANSLERTVTYSKTWVDKNGKLITEDVLGYPVEVSFRLDVAEYTRSQTGTDQNGKPVYSYEIVGGENGWKTASEYFDPDSGNIHEDAFNAIFNGSTPPFSQTLTGHLGDAAVWGVEFAGPTQLPVAIRKANGKIALLTYRVVETEINRIGENGTKIPVVTFEVQPSDDGKKYTYTYPEGSFFTPVYFPDGLGSDKEQAYNHSYTRDLYNTLDEATLTVTKQWVGDHQNAYDTRPTTTRTGGYTWQTSFLIQRKSTGENWEHVYTQAADEGTMAIGKPLIVTLYGNDSQAEAESKIYGLPVQDGEGMSYTYRVRELSADLNWVDTTDPEVSAAIQDITEKGDQSEYVLGADARYNTAYTVTYPADDPMTAVNTLDSTKLYASKEWIRDEILTTGVTFQLQYQVSATQWRNVSAPAGTVALNGKADTPAAGDPSYELDPETTSPYRWMAVWEDLPLRMPDSWLTDENPVTNYRIVETVADGQGGSYIQTSAAEDYSNGGEDYTIWRFVNTQKTTYQVQKAWGLDAGVNPPNATVTLYRTTDESKIGTGQGEPVNVIGNPHTFSGRTPVVKTFSSLPKYDENHQLYYYYALETKIGTTDVGTPDESGYASIGTGAGRYDAYHTWAADHAKTTVVNIGYKNISITKVWKDNGDAYDTRPDHLTLTLWRTPAGGTEEKVEVVQPAWTDNGDNTWTLTYTGLPMADSQGRVYTYRVEEGDIEAAPGKGSYVTTGPETVSGGFRLTNTLTGTTQLTVTKNWVDGGNTDQTRPQSITVTLHQNGEPMPGKTVEIKAPNALQQLFGADSNQWSYTFENLPKYDGDGKEYVYTVTEEPVNGYNSAQSGTTFTNTLLTSVQVEKIWPGVAEADKKPVTVKLCRTTADNPTEDDWTEVPADEGGGKKNIDAQSNWIGIYEGLDRFDETGSRYKFKVVETAIGGNPVTDDDYIIQYGEKDTSTAGLIQLLVANIEPGKLTGTKTWKDNGNAYSTRPSELELILERTTVWNNPTADDWKEVPAGEYTLAWTNTDTDEWTYTYEGFPSGDGEGNLYLYRVREEAVDPLPGGDYYEETSGSSADYDFINTLRGTLDIPVAKVWVDNSDAFGLRPEQITLELYANGGTDPVQTAQLSASGLVSRLLGDDPNIWRYTFEDLPKYDDNGAYITYEVREVLTAEAGERFEVTVYPESADASDLPAEGFTLTNTGEGQLLITKTVTGSRGDRKKDFTFTPVFVDSADEELTEAFPYEKTLQDGTVQTGEIISSESFLLKDGESMKIDGLPGGTRYTVTESDNAGYRVSYAGTAGEILPGVELTASFNNYRGGGGSDGGGGGTPPDPKPEEDPTPDDSLPQTGQNWMLPLLLAIAGGALVATGTWMNRRKRRERHDA